MNCDEAEAYVSDVYDGEQVPPIAAQHIEACERCRRVLNDYSRMGAELRLAAAMEPIELPPLRLTPRTRRFDWLWRRASVPRFALASLVACLILAIATISLVRAQSRPLWFEFGYGFQNSGDLFHYTVAKDGYDEPQAIMGFANGVMMAAALRVKVENISDDDVVLRCRAVPAKVQMHPGGGKLLGPPDGGVSLDAAPTIHYKPGESLVIPIEGGGTLYLKGDVLDHQPRLAFGLPLEPAADKLVFRSPVLTSSDQLIGELNGATAIATNETYGIIFQAGQNGRFTFALHPFSGAVQGELNWGEITFKLTDTKYRLLAAAPITGGDQPRPVWVRLDPGSTGDVALGSMPVPNE